jgi:peptidoglycan/LPS O-acetylase OafA/YrhL
VSLTTRPFESRAPRLGSVKPFDGIRGVGVWCVVLQHAYAVADSLSGYIDLFFVLSGFLITTLIFEEQRAVGAVSLRNFYARRGIRLLPGLIVTLIVFFLPILAIRIMNPNPDTDYLFTNVVWESVTTFFYVHNIFFSPLLGSFQYMGQMWSLSLEEQFYLVGALTTYLCIKKGWIRQLAIGLTAVILFIWVARALGHGGPGQFWFQRPDAIAMGVLLAIINAVIPTELSPEVKRRLHPAAWIATIGMVIALLSSSKLIQALGGPYVPLYPTDVDIEAPPEGLSPTELKAYADNAIQAVLAQLPDGNYWVRWGFTLSTLCAAVIVFAFVRLRDDFALGRWLSGKTLCYFGVLSYAIYITHYQLFKLMDPGFQRGPKWIPIKLLAAYLVGAALHRWVEKPALRKYRQRFTHTPATTPK